MNDLVSAFRRCDVVDASATITSGMPVFPGHPSVEIIATRTREREGYYLQTLSLGEHTGSHVDAPAHVLGAGAGMTIDAVPVARFRPPTRSSTSVD